MRKTQFQTDYYYHIYNRGTDRRKIFVDKNDFVRFILSMREFNQTELIGSIYHKQKRDKKLSLAQRSVGLNLVSIVAYCLIPNHYHFLLKQIRDGGISKFMHRLGLGYTKYFNHKQKRSGSLFQGTFKSVEIKTDAQLYYTSAYVNANSEIHKICKADKYEWCSYLDYLNIRKGNLCDKQNISKDFSSIDDYQNYVNEVINNSKQIKEEFEKLEN